jgi:uncharacterized protein (TIGR00369 family)
MTDENQAESFNRRQAGHLPGELGLHWNKVVRGEAIGRFRAELRHMAPNGFLHAASVIALADTACGYGCVASLPEGGAGFTTLELKSNFLGTAKPGDEVAVRAWLVHGGRTTQVWDAEVTNATTGKAMALFRATQLVIYPR